ncbi:MAG: group II intron reverse transcriptase/maturase [Verrucomicrobia bacterium]|nr:group II intron reverse transcriptase/maturase [Verrucomicrobiota bacterium]
MDMLWMREAFAGLRKDASPGVDGTTVDEYAMDLEANLADLLERAKSGRYRPPPVKRGYVPKGEHESRLIGIPTTENKVLERAVAMLLEPLYECDFMESSYGFRPHRSPHQALEALRGSLKEMKGGWVLDVDIRKFFDSIPHCQLMEILRLRVKDSVILRLAAKWLRAGVMEDGGMRFSDEGTPQGGVVSPLLSNIYLHHVLDGWFETMIKPRLRGPAQLIRFADDFVMVFKRLDDAQRVFDVLPKRFEKYGLAIHPGKTKLVDFRHPWDSGKKPDTFTFLGFTHYWGKTRKGGYSVKKKTSSKKMRQKLKDMHQWCKKNRHRPLEWQHSKICQKLLGHYAFYGVTGNFASIAIFRYKVLYTWRYWLNRRSRKRDGMEWDRFRMLLASKFQIPPPRIVHGATGCMQTGWSF